MGQSSSRTRCKIIDAGDIFKKRRRDVQKARVGALRLISSFASKEPSQEEDGEEVLFFFCRVTRLGNGKKIQRYTLIPVPDTQEQIEKLVRLMLIKGWYSKVLCNQDPNEPLRVRRYQDPQKSLQKILDLLPSGVRQTLEGPDVEFVFTDLG
ncbi:MAG: hypothetical protein ABIB04_01485 [Patescibacteria group bacterium]